ncbi:phage tail protein [Enterobacteriaceae bacterium BIT-l23]|uniref:phage tail protein n=1 Tax=Jejubacter sp. L23 TaxID=3092086 RepID=UPI0015856DF5|nr:phage tail protein [Enterobacteriaceae bacterium BIT-l23]
MGFALPNGSHVYLASEYADAVPFTDITNAENAVITVASATGLQEDDIVHITSGWSGISDVVAKITAVDGTSVTLGNIDTTNVNKYPAGSGAGSIRVVSEWTELPQITEVANAGGDQNTTQIQFLSDDRQRNLNTFKAASSQTYTIAHDSSLPVYPLLDRLDENGDTVAAYMYIPKAKENRYWSATVSFNKIPATAVNEVETVTVALQLQSPAMTFYKIADDGSTPGS